MQSKEAVERFQREARAAVRLAASTSRACTDVGTLDSGAPYMVMEFLEGADLSHVVQATGAIPIEESVRLRAPGVRGDRRGARARHRPPRSQAAESLPHAPRGRQAARQGARLRHLEVDRSTQSGLSLTRTSAIMGSPLYMSPEQMRSSKNVDSARTSGRSASSSTSSSRVAFRSRPRRFPSLCLKVVQDPVEPPKRLRPEVSGGSERGRREVSREGAESSLRERRGARGGARAVLGGGAWIERAHRGDAELPSRPPMVSISAISSSSNPENQNRRHRVGNDASTRGAKRSGCRSSPGASRSASSRIVRICFALKSRLEARTCCSAARRSKPPPPRRPPRRRRRRQKRRRRRPPHRAVVDTVAVIDIATDDDGAQRTPHARRRRRRPQSHRRLRRTRRPL